MTTWTLPRESVEWVGPVTVTANGTPTTAFELALLQSSNRPTAASWQTPVTLDGGQGLMVSGRAPGTYRLWARVTSTPETPVLEVGMVQIT